MNFQSKTYHSPLYRDFKEIDGNAFRTIVRFYEEYEPDIEALPFAEYFDLLYNYATSLFHIKQYRQFLNVADRIIETSISDNIRFWNGEDLFISTLFRKAAAHHQLLELDEAEYVLKELIKINPTDKQIQMLLRRNFRRKRSRLVRNFRAVCIFCLLLSALIVIFEVLFVRTFYTRYLPDVQTLRNLVFVTGVIILASGDVYNYLSATWKTLRITQKSRRNR